MVTARISWGVVGILLRLCPELLALPRVLLSYILGIFAALKRCTIFLFLPHFLTPHRHREFSGVLHLTMADFEIFRDRLLQAYPTYGQALWDPNPTRLDKPVKVGDVGFMRWGKFHGLFNALLPADHPSHNLGVPEGHEPLVPNLADHINTSSLSCGHYCSGEVGIEPEPNTTAR